MIPFFRCILLCAVLSLAGCLAEEKPAPAPTDPVSKKIEAFTGGHTRIAWARYVGSGSDVFGNFDKLQLWGIDSRDGLGIRPILEETSNYARPLILPDGSGLIFTNKQTGKKPSGKRAFDPVAFRVDWDGQNLTELGPGYAVEVWRDPETEKDWVYCTDLLPTERSSIEGSKLERYPLDDPSKRELVWDKTKVSTENIQLSRSGDRASCLFPWPHAGVLNLEAMSHQKYQHGCWPSLAPDDSHFAWVFDGAHKNLHLFTDGAADHWVVPVNTAPGVDGHEMYHPRWSNHPRYITVTGPYTGATVTRSDAGEVEIFLARFSPDAKQIEEWLQVTDDEAGDVFPDVWIDGGSLASLETPGDDGKQMVATSEDASGTGREWPVGEGPFLFVWKNRTADNTISGQGSRECSVEASDRARFGPNQEMLTDGGQFEMDEETQEAIGGHAGAWTLELLARPLLQDQTGFVARFPFGDLAQVGDEWVFARVGGDAGVRVSLGKVDLSKPNHLVVSFDGKSTHRTFREGIEAGVDEGKVPVLSVEPKLYGSGNPLESAGAADGFGAGWSGSIEGIVVSASADSPEAITASFESWDKALAARDPIPTVRLRGKLTQMTESRPVEALDTYTRGLLGYLYEVEEVLEGDYESDQVIVLHWTILDRKPLSGFPREIGKSYELTIQPGSAHPELTSERQWNDLFAPVEPWFDVTTPGE